MKLYIKKIFIHRVYQLLAYDKAEKALKLIDLYSKIFSFDNIISLALAFTFSQLKLEESFNKQFKIIEKYFEGTYHLNFLLASNYSLKGMYDKAIKEMDLALEIDKNESTIYNNRGYYKSKIGQYKESIKDLNKSIKLNPKQYFAYNNLGYSKIMLGDISGIEEIKFSIKKDSNNAVAYINLAIWELKFGNKNKIPLLIRDAKSKKHYLQVKDEVEKLTKQSSS